MKIFIDAGHNFSGADTGAQGNGLREQDITFMISNKLKKLLEQGGHHVKMSRNKLEDNVGKTTSEALSLRCRMANEWGAELYVSIHTNAFDGKANGTETLVYSLESKSVPTAKRIQKAIIEEFGTRDRGVKARPDLYVLRKTTMPAVLVETAFIDNSEDAKLLKDKQDGFAKAIYEGITGEKVKGSDDVGQTVMELNGKIYVQEIAPSDFDIQVVDKAKKDIKVNKYFNCGFFSAEKGGKTIPVGNLASGGKIISQAKDNASWINVAGHKLTTIYTAVMGVSKQTMCFMTKTDDLSSIPNLKTAISGIPIISGGKRVSLSEIKSEGYFGNEVYDTWHGFLGIRNGKLCYVAMKCGFEEMCWNLVALGIYDAIKLDGGGSFVLKDEKIIEATSENRRIHNVGGWSA
jgi:N-acetylmuramoyl-L-alanine amidase